MGDTWFDTFNGRSVRRKASVYTRKHNIQKKKNKHQYFLRDSNSRSRYSSAPRPHER